MKANKESQKLFKKLLCLFIVPHIIGIISLLAGNVFFYILSNISVLILIFICFKIIDKYNYVIVDGDKELKNREEKVDKFIKKRTNNDRLGNI